MGEFLLSDATETSVGPAGQPVGAPLPQGARVGPFDVVRTITEGPGATLLEAHDSQGRPRLLQVVRLKAVRGEAEREARHQEERRVARRTTELIGEPGLEVHAHGGADAEDGTRHLFWALPLEGRRPLAVDGAGLDLVAFLRLTRALAARLAERHGRGRLEPLLSEHTVGVGEAGEPRILAVPVDVSEAWLAPVQPPPRRAPEELDGVPTKSGDVWRLGQLLGVASARLVLPASVAHMVETLGREDPSRRPASGAELLLDVDGLLASAPELMQVPEPPAAELFPAEDVTQSSGPLTNPIPTPGVSDPLAVTSWGSAVWTEVDGKPLAVAAAALPAVVVDAVDPDAPTRAETAEAPGALAGVTDPEVASSPPVLVDAHTDPSALPTVRPEPATDEAAAARAEGGTDQLALEGVPELDEVDPADVEPLEETSPLAEVAEVVRAVEEAEGVEVGGAPDAEQFAHAHAHAHVHGPEAEAEVEAGSEVGIDHVHVYESEGGEAAAEGLDAVGVGVGVSVADPPAEAELSNAVQPAEAPAEAAAEAEGGAPLPADAADTLTEDHAVSAVLMRSTAEVDGPEPEDRMAMDAIAAGWAQPLLPAGESPWSEVVTPRGTHRRDYSSFPGFDEELPKAAGVAPAPAVVAAPTPAAVYEDHALDPGEPSVAEVAAAVSGFDTRKLAGGILAVLVILGLFALIARTGEGEAPAPADVALPTQEFVLESRPAGAWVVAERDGRVLGKTPLSFLVPAGSHPQVFLVAPEHEPMRLELLERGGVEARLEPSAAEACTVALSSPDGLRLTGFDDTPLTPGDVRVQGALLVRAAAGQEQQGARLVVCPERGGAPKVNLHFNPRWSGASIRVTEPAGAAAYVNGDPLGRVPTTGRVDRAFVEVRVDDAEGMSESRWVPARGPLEVRMPTPKPRRRPVLVVPDNRPEDADSQAEIQAALTPGLAPGAPAGRVERLLKAGHRHLKAGRHRKASQAFRECLRMAPNEPACVLGLGHLYRRLEKADKAKVYFARYLELAPAAPDAERVRAYLAE